PVQALHFGQPVYFIYRILTAEIELRAPGRPLFGGDNDGTAGGAQAVERGGGGALQHRHRGDVFGVEVAGAVGGTHRAAQQAIESRAATRRSTFLKRRVVHYHPIDDEQRLVVAVERGAAPNHDASPFARPAARGGDIDPRHLALQGVHDIGLARLDNIFATNLLHGRYEVAPLLLDAVAQH
nr:hypothetical protein [Tanacetum cinerariifolium]